MRIIINENLIADYLYDQVKDDPEFNCLGLDRQGEVIVEVVNEVDRVMAELFPPVNFGN